MHKVYNPACDKSGYNFDEMCPFCEKYVPIVIDYNCFDHYQIECPKCGYNMMLCTLCRWDQEDEDGFSGEYRCDWSEQNGCFRKEEMHEILRGEFFEDEWWTSGLFFQ